MKISEFKKLIREEVRKVLKEANAPAYSFNDIIDMLKTWDTTTGNTPKKRKIVKILNDIGVMDGDMIAFEPQRQYKTTDNKPLEDVFKWWSKYVKATRLSDFSKSPSSGKSPNAGTNKVPTSGKKITDSDLVDDGYISEDHMDEWLDLLSDERIPDGWINNTAQKAKILKLANTWLKKNGYAWQVADALNQDEEGVVTWKIK